MHYPNTNIRINKRFEFHMHGTLILRYDPVPLIPLRSKQWEPYSVMQISFSQIDELSLPFYRTHQQNSQSLPDEFVFRAFFGISISLALLRSSFGRITDAVVWKDDRQTILINEAFGYGLSSHKVCQINISKIYHIPMSSFFRQGIFC